MIDLPKSRYKQIAVSTGIAGVWLALSFIFMIVLYDEWYYEVFRGFSYTHRYTEPVRKIILSVFSLQEWTSVFFIAFVMIAKDLVVPLKHLRSVTMTFTGFLITLLLLALAVFLDS